MVHGVYAVHLSVQEKGRLKKLIRGGRNSTQAITRARILLKIDEGWPAPQVATALDVSERTVFRTKRRYVEEGLEEVLRHHNSPHPYPKVGGKVEAHPVSSTGQALIAVACSPAPEGRVHWTLRALAGKVVELGLVESLSHETVRLHLKKLAQAPVSGTGQAVAKAAVVHPQGRRGVRGSHRGCAAPLRRTLRPAEARGLLRRDLHPTADRDQGSPPGRALTSQAGGLRVPERGHPQPVSELRPHILGVAAQGAQLLLRQEPDAPPPLGLQETQELSTGQNTRQDGVGRLPMSMVESISKRLLFLILKC